MADPKQKLPEVPMTDDWPTLRQFLQSMRSVIQANQSTAIRPTPPTNVRLVAIAGGAKVQWTMSGAEGYTVMVSDTPSWNADSGRYIDAGESSEYTDMVGVGGVTRWYWVRAYNGFQASDSVQAGSATTLALGTDATLPASVIPASSVIVQSNKTGRAAVGRIVQSGKVVGE